MYSGRTAEKRTQLEIGERVFFWVRYRTAPALSLQTVPEGDPGRPAAVAAVLNASQVVSRACVGPLWMTLQHTRVRKGHGRQGSLESAVPKLEV